MRSRHLAICTLLLACGSENASPPGLRASDAGRPAPRPSDDPGDAPVPSLSDDAGSPSTPSSDCSEAAKLVYVVSVENELHSFDPAHLTFTKIGTLACPASPGATPFSMAVDRSAIAWVNYSDGSLFKVRTSDASCTATSFVPQTGFSTFGMGFSSNTAGSTDETLFLYGFGYTTGGSLGLAKIDLSSLALTPIGSEADKLAERAELTGTADSKLYGFFMSETATLAEIDKATGKASSPRPLPTIPNIGLNSGFAFSFWGGDFWFYTATRTGVSATSAVTQLKMSDGSVNVVKENVGFTIVGAGVSTCAPTVAPR